MKDPNANACPEYRDLSRRRFLTLGAQVTAAAVTAPAWLPKLAFAQDGAGARDVVISVYLRGGIDGLSACVPFGDPNYYSLRPTIAIPRPDANDENRCIDLDGFFGLAPAMAALKPAYDESHLLFIQGVGAPNWSRSHFDAQRWMEVGSPGDVNTVSGWLGRHLASVPPAKAGSLLRAACLTHGMQRTVVGAPQALPIPDLAKFGFNGDYADEAEMRQWISTQYGRMANPVQAAARDTQGTIDLLERIDFANYQPQGGAEYPEEGGFARSMRSTAALLKADVGVEAVHIDFDGWDTHSDQDPNSGYMRNLMQKLSQSMAAFHADMLAGERRNWTMVVLSEFGRNARENGSRGTDHGYGNAMMMLGPNVKGGRVFGPWPGMHPDQLFQGVDLKSTVDFRDVLAELVAKRLRNSNLKAVFPGYSAKFHDLVA